jgi:hypothetical protein
METPEDSDCLLRLDLISHAELGRSLYKDEARWACRIRPAVAGLDAYHHWILAFQYAQRGRVRAILGPKGPGTAFLDALLAIKPWHEENKPLWREAVRRGFITSSDVWLHWFEPPVFDPDVFPDTLAALGISDDKRLLNGAWRDNVLHRLKFTQPWCLADLKPLKVEQRFMPDPTSQ